MRRAAAVTVLVLALGLSACSTADTSSAPPPSSSTAEGSVVVERGLQEPTSATVSSPAATQEPVERGIVFGGFADVIGGMTLAEVRGLGWMLVKTGGGDGCTDYRYRRGSDEIQVGSKNGSEVVSTVVVASQNGRLSAETARIRSSTATYGQIVAAYQDASITYTPPLNRGPSGSVGKLVVASNSQPDRVILFTAAGPGVSDTAPPPADAVFTGAEGGTLSASTGGTFGCA